MLMTSVASGDVDTLAAWMLSSFVQMHACILQRHLASRVHSDEKVLDEMESAHEM